MKTKENGGYQGLRKEGNSEMLVKGYKLPVIRRIISGNFMYSMLMIVNNNVYLKVGKRVGLKCSHPSPSNSNSVR